MGKFTAAAMRQRGGTKPPSIQMSAPARCGLNLIHSPNKPTIYRTNGEMAPLNRANYKAKLIHCGPMTVRQIDGNRLNESTGPTPDQ